jgi:hypothetical protein
MDFFYLFFFSLSENFAFTIYVGRAAGTLVKIEGEEYFFLRKHK